jgi:hypothetical protein
MIICLVYQGTEEEHTSDDERRKGKGKLGTRPKPARRLRTGPAPRNEAAQQAGAENYYFFLNGGMRNINYVLCLPGKLFHALMFKIGQKQIMHLLSLVQIWMLLLPSCEMDVND